MLPALTPRGAPALPVPLVRRATPALPAPMARRVPLVRRATRAQLVPTALAALTARRATPALPVPLVRRATPALPAPMARRVPLVRRATRARLVPERPLPARLGRLVHQGVKGDAGTVGAKGDAGPDGHERCRWSRRRAGSRATWCRSPTMALPGPKGDTGTARVPRATRASRASRVRSASRVPRQQGDQGAPGQPGAIGPLGPDRPDRSRWPHRVSWVIPARRVTTALRVPRATTAPLAPLVPTALLVPTARTARLVLLGLRVQKAEDGAVGRPATPVLPGPAGPAGATGNTGPAGARGPAPGLLGANGQGVQSGGHDWAGAREDQRHELQHDVGQSARRRREAAVVHPSPHWHGRLRQEAPAARRRCIGRRVLLPARRFGWNGGTGGFGTDVRTYAFSVTAKATVTGYTALTTFAVRYRLKARRMACRAKWSWCRGRSRWAVVAPPPSSRVASRSWQPRPHKARPALRQECERYGEARSGGPRCVVDACDAMCDTRQAEREGAAVRHGAILPPTDMPLFAVAAPTRCPAMPSRALHSRHVTA